MLQIAVLLCANSAHAALREIDFEAPPHSYYERPLNDRFTRLKLDFEQGRVPLNGSSETAFVRSLLEALEIPVSSQMLVFSTTSLQLSLISPSNPRALYFNEDTYVGYIPGGKIEIISLDPELGGIFYIFDIPRNSAPIQAERSRRCMNCHARSETGYVPGLVIKSVLPGSRGGSLEAFRIDETGHQIPLSERFGGWYLTGAPAFSNSLANVLGRSVNGEIEKQMINPGELFAFARYPVSTSDILPQLLHEHQAGFVNRVLRAAYRARSMPASGPLSSAESAELDETARALTAYILFAQETPLPPGGVEGDPSFRADFLRNRKVANNGASLKDFDLESRLFKYRCSYMIYSPVFAALPDPVKQRVLRELRSALEKGSPGGSHLGPREKRVIREILDETLPDYAAARLSVERGGEAKP